MSQEMPQMDPKLQATVAEDEDGHEEDWESDGEGEVPSGEMIIDILELGEQHNKLLKALLSHPKMKRDDPNDTPVPLRYVADFVRRTYIEFLLPILPQEAVLRSSRFANRYLFGYPDHHPEPTDPANDYLTNPANWSTDSSTPEMFRDAQSRMMTMYLTITDEVKGPMLLQGHFDWVNPVNIKAIVTEMMAKPRS